METLTSFKLLFRLASVVLIVLVIAGCDITISDPIDEPAALLPIDTPTVIIHQKVPAPAQATVTEAIKKANVTPSQKARSTATKAVTSTATTIPATATTVPATVTASPTFSPTSTPDPLVHVVSAGDTLTGIMERYDISLKALLAENPDLSEYGYLTIDQEIIILPDEEDEDEDEDEQEEIAMRSSPLPSPSPFPSPSASPTPSSTNTPTPSGPPTTEEGHIIHFVQVGETISQIAGQYDVKRNDILLANGLRPDALLVAGDTLIIPQGPYTAIPTATPLTATAVPTLEITLEPTATATKKINTPTPTVVPTQVLTYTIASGDVASIIADQHDVTIEELQEANPNLNLETLTIGDEVVIPPPSEDEEEEEKPTATSTSTPTAITIEPSATATQVPAIIITHVVKAGETLRKIAEQNELAEDTLTEYNPDIEETDEELEEEMVVQVPVGTATLTPSVTPIPSLTPTPAPDYLAPILILPANGEKWVHTDEAKPLQLAWTSPGILQENESYVIRLRAYDEKNDLLWSHSEWTENPYWEVPSELLAQVEGEVILKWDVLVMRLTSEPGVEPKTGEALSDKSETYELIYLRDIPKEE